MLKLTDLYYCKPVMPTFAKVLSVEKIQDSHYRRTQLHGIVLFQALKLDNSCRGDQQSSLTSLGTSTGSYRRASPRKIGTLRIVRVLMHEYLLYRGTSLMRTHRPQKNPHRALGIGLR